MQLYNLLSLCDEKGTCVRFISEKARAEEIEIKDISLDSRHIQKDSLFVALKGQNHHGIDFAKTALEAGATGLLCDEEAARNFPNIIKQFEYCLISTQPRALLGILCQGFFQPKPKSIVAVTGTNGKTSVASFYRQIAQYCAHDAAQIGTTGVIAPHYTIKDTLTSPDTIALHRLLQSLAQTGHEYVALEASSHGLHQQRLAGITLNAVAFTNLTQDHLDYHSSMEAYLDAKSRLFSEFSGENCPAIVNMASDKAPHFVALAHAQNAPLISISYDTQNQGYIHLLKREVAGYQQHLHLIIDGKSHEITLPLAGQFQAENALVALGLAIGTGIKYDNALEALSQLQGAKGRLEHVASTPEGAGIFVDYAHTPDALAKALLALRQVTQGRLIVVFGAGGNRDKDKRAKMGAIAASNADIAIITDDNPRDEDPKTIRAMIKQACSDGVDIAGRKQAILYGITQLQQGDSLLIAGKGHEDYQEIKGVKYPFSDHAIIKEVFIKY